MIAYNIIALFVCTSVPRSIPATAKLLEPTQPPHTQTSPPKSTSQEGTNLIEHFAAARLNTVSIQIHDCLIMSP